MRATAYARVIARAGVTACAGVTAYAVLSLLGSGLWNPSAPAATPAAAESAPHLAAITHSAHLTFENCTARHVILSVTVARHAFTPGEAVGYTVRLTNTGRTTCGQALAQIPQARRSLTVGPCGTLAAVVRNARGVNVNPGPVSYSCPVEFGFRLGPHSSASTTGSWNQTVILGRGSPAATPQQAPPGTYRLVVGHAVTVPVVLVPG